MKKWVYAFCKRFSSRSRENNDIDYKIMQKMIRENPNICVIDVRTKDEFRYRHLDGAVNIPLQDISESRIARVVNNKSSSIIVYCEYGGRSKKAVVKLRKYGYENVYNLEGGMANI